jgi:hypothetical protein
VTRVASANHPCLGAGRYVPNLRLSKTLPAEKSALPAKSVRNDGYEMASKMFLLGDIIRFRAGCKAHGWCTVVTFIGVRITGVQACGGLERAITYLKPMPLDELEPLPPGLSPFR